MFNYFFKKYLNFNFVLVSFFFNHKKDTNTKFLLTPYLTSFKVKSSSFYSIIFRFFSIYLIVFFFLFFLFFFYGFDFKFLFNFKPLNNNFLDFIFVKNTFVKYDWFFFKQLNNNSLLFSLFFNNFILNSFFSFILNTFFFFSFYFKYYSVNFFIYFISDFSFNLNNFSFNLNNFSFFSFFFSFLFFLFIFSLVMHYFIFFRSILINRSKKNSNNFINKFSIYFFKKNILDLGNLINISDYNKSSKYILYLSFYTSIIIYFFSFNLF